MVPTFPVSLVKIDVEGHENSVLRGMRKFLAEKRPPLVMFEYLQRTNLAETLEFFAGIGYRVFELGKNGPVAAAAPQIHHENFEVSLLQTMGFRFCGPYNRGNSILHSPRLERSDVCFETRNGILYYKERPYSGILDPISTVD